MNSSTDTTKCWWYIMPIVFIICSPTYLDRVNFSFVSTAGITEDLGIIERIPPLLRALSFLGYFFFQVFGAIYAERRSIRKLIFIYPIPWSDCTSLTGVVYNILALAAVCFIPGAVEAVVMPAILAYISDWFTRPEHSHANTFLILSNPMIVLWMSVVSGYLIQAFGQWKMFTIKGVPAVIQAFCWWVLIKDEPSQVNWLTEDEKAALQEQLDREQQDTKAMHNHGETFHSRNVILFCAQYFAWSIGVYGFVLWLPSTIHSDGGNMGMVEVGWFFSVPYLTVITAMIVVSWASDEIRNHKLFVWPLPPIGGLVFVGSWAVGTNRLWASYTLLVVAGTATYAPYGPFFAITPEMLSRNVTGGAMVLISSMGILNFFCGPWFVGYPDGATDSPAASYILMGVALFAPALLALTVKPANSQNIPFGVYHV